MKIDPNIVRTDFGQGVSDQALFDKAAAIRTQVKTMVSTVKG